MERAALIGGVMMKKVPTDKNFSVRGEVLKRMIEEDKAAGLIPFFVRQKPTMASDQWPVYSMYNVTSTSSESSGLRQCLDSQCDLRARVLQVCATLGTTPSCAFDCITEMGPICESALEQIESFSHTVCGFYRP